MEQIAITYQNFTNIKGFKKKKSSNLTDMHKYFVIYFSHLNHIYLSTVLSYGIINCKVS